MTSTAVKQLITILKALHDWNDKDNKGDKLVMTINDDYASVYNAASCKVITGGNKSKYAREHGVDIIVFDRNYEEVRNIC